MSKTGPEVLVKTVADSEDGKRFTWRTRLSVNSAALPLKRRWAEAHGVREEMVAFADPATLEPIKLGLTPSQLRWEGEVTLLALPAESPPPAEAAPDAKLSKRKAETQQPAKPLVDPGKKDLPGKKERIKFAENPKRVGSTAHARYEKYKHAETIEEALRCGAVEGDILHDFKKGFLRRA